MSMIDAGRFDNYRKYSVTPSWQKIERYEYCSQSIENHTGSVQRLYEKIKNMIRG